MVKSTKDIFIENLKRLRKERFKSQELFAAKVEMSVRGYQKYEQGESDPIPETIDKFAKSLKCTSLDLLAEPGSLAGQFSRPSPTHLKGLIEAPESAQHTIVALVLQELLAVAPDVRAATLAVLYGDAAIAAPYASRKKTPSSK